MHINEQAIYGLIGERFKGNISNFCRALHLDYSGVWKVLNGQSSGTQKFIPALYSYCIENKIDFTEFFN